MNDDRAILYNLPPVYNRVEKHGAFPDISHDETARFNFLTGLNRHLNRIVEPGVKAIFEKRVRPRFEAQTGRLFTTADEIQEMMMQDSQYQVGSALRRSTIEMIQQATRSVVLRQIDELAEKARYYNNQRPETLKLNPAVEIPCYLSVIDQGCMPGSYYTEYGNDDVTNAANYDAGQFLITDGRLGKLSDGIGRGLVQWLRLNYPTFSPKQILDIGCGSGYQTLPVAMGYPDADIIGVDVSAPMLRYGHARMVALGVDKVTFWQANAEQLPFVDNSFDLVFTTRFLHEIPANSVEAIIQEIYRILKPNGLMLHIDQAGNAEAIPLFDQFVHNWRALTNNELFSLDIPQRNIVKWLHSGGFAERDRLQFGIEVINDFAGKSTPIEAGAERVAPLIQHVFGGWK
ncbi:class I SAM-dependent methyltransferase [Spirosoma sp. SC4-14]|uniref:class I SAM-dependent methyltransferase n=1 Tax=Spirosoma sp. SC4-14 TaxID=3128900 RepID=UPI0030CFA4EC